MLNEGGDTLSSYLSDRPLNHVCRSYTTFCRYLTGGMLSASITQRIVWLQLLSSFQMTMAIPVNSNAKRKV